MKKTILIIIFVLLTGVILLGGYLKLNNINKFKTKEIAIKEEVSRDNISYFDYQHLREKCNKGSYGCFYFIALLEADNILFTSKKTCPKNYSSLSNEEIGYNHKINEFSGLTYCKKNEKNKLKAKSRQEIEKIKNKMLKNSSPRQCYDLKLEKITYENYKGYRPQKGILGKKLRGLKLEDFKEEYTPMILDWQINCLDVSYNKEDKILFYSKIKDKYYLAEENNLEFFLKGEKKFLIKKFSVFLGKEDHDTFFGQKIIDTHKSYNSKIVKTVMNSDYKINGLEELAIEPIDGKAYGYCIKPPIYLDKYYDSPPNKPTFCREYKMKNPYRGNLFLAYEEKITQKAKNTCSERRWADQISDVKIFLLEISDNFEILSKEEIYLEKGLKRSIPCNLDLWILPILNFLDNIDDI